MRRWRGRKTRRDNGWDSKEGKPVRAPRVLQVEGPVREFVSVVLVRAGTDETAVDNIKMVVPGDSTFGDFMLTAAQALNAAGEHPVLFTIPPRPVQPDAAVTMSSFPKPGFLYVTYHVHV